MSIILIIILTTSEVRKVYSLIVTHPIVKIWLDPDQQEAYTCSCYFEHYTAVLNFDTGTQKYYSGLECSGQQEPTTLELVCNYYQSIDTVASE